MTPALDLTELNLALDNCRDCADGDNLTDARYFLTVADHLLAAAQEHLATEPHPFPAPVSALLPDAGATSEGEPPLPDSPSRWCLKCGEPLTDLEEDTCWRCVPKGDAS